MSLSLSLYIYIYVYMNKRFSRVFKGFLEIKVLENKLDTLYRHCLNRVRYRTYRSARDGTPSERAHGPIHDRFCPVRL